MLVQEVDEEKVEDPLTGLSGNSSDLSDSEKSSSMQDLKMKWAGDLTRSLSARRQRSGSRLDHPSYRAKFGSQLLKKKLEVFFFSSYKKLNEHLCFLAGASWTFQR